MGVTAHKGTFFATATEANAKSQIAKPLVVFGYVVTPGATPDKVKAMTRAGIPPVKIAEHVNDEDYWATGATYRERHATQMTQKRERSFHSKPSEKQGTDQSLHRTRSESSCHLIVWQSHRCPD